MGYRDRDVRAERIKHASKSHFGWRAPAADDDAKRHTIGGNAPPQYDPDAPPTKFMVLRDIDPFTTQEGRHITSRSKLRAYESETGTKQSGNDWTGPEKPAFHDEMTDKLKHKARKRRA